MSPEAIARMRAQAGGSPSGARSAQVPSRAGNPAPGRNRPDEKARKPELKLLDASKAATARRRRRAKRMLLASTVLVLFGIVCSHAYIDENQFRIDAMKTALTDAQAQNAKLTLQVAQLRAPQRIVTAAEMDFGMVVPSSITYLYPVSPNAQLPAPPAGKG